MRTGLSTSNLLDAKPKMVVQFTSNHLQQLFNGAEVNGGWLIYGAEKNGKTWLALQLLKELCKHQQVAYISAEEGLEGSFQAAVIRAGINKSHKIQWYDYMPVSEIIEKFSKRRTANIIFIDNLTIYADELKRLGTRELEKKLPNKLFIYLAHEERGKPYTSAAMIAKKFAKVYVHIKGLVGTVISRFGPGGNIVIDDTKAEMYWGSNILN